MTKVSSLLSFTSFFVVIVPEYCMADNLNRTNIYEKVPRKRERREFLE